MKQNQGKMTILKLRELIANREAGIACSGLNTSATAFMLSRLINELQGPFILVTNSRKASESIEKDLKFFIPRVVKSASKFPAYNLSPYKFMAYHNETASRRIGTLFQLASADTPRIIITTIDALLQKVIPRRQLIDFAELIMTGEICPRDELIEKLIAGGYSPTTIVEEPGDYCARGMLLDVFSPGYNDPLRIDFFGDTVDTIKQFSAASQRTYKELTEAIILPAKEAVLYKHERLDVISRIRKEAAKLEMPVSRVREFINQLKHEGTFKGAESLLPLIYPRLNTLFDYVPEDALFVLLNTSELERVAVDTMQRVEDNYVEARNKGHLCVEPDQLFLSWKRLRELLDKQNPIILRPFALLKGKLPSHGPDSVCHFEVHENSDLQNTLNHPETKEFLLTPLVDWIKKGTQAGFKTVLVCRSKLHSERLQSLLVPYGIKPQFNESFPTTIVDNRAVYNSLGKLSGGFVWPEEKVAIVTEEEIFGSHYRMRTKVKRPKPSELVIIEDLKAGDLVVHTEHGIGRYGGLVKITMNGTTNDYLAIYYRDDDKLYLPVDRMNMVQKYLGVDGVVPVLDKMGGRTWARVKAKVKKSAEKIAGELLKLYAARKVTKGVTFKPLDRELSEFETGFTFDETADQLKAIDDVLNDMAQPIPMDRLICGDVGYGKTEVALRASFVSVYNGKQVAVLVPTTVLSEQHYVTFSKRFEQFPVRIACLNRFRSSSDQRTIVKDIQSGKIDIVIGTHRLLSKDVVFKDLGLLILDEEQRFGVKHKEKLKALRRNIDALTLTATPIPRTLHMSLMGTRDISVISTPPEYRQAIMTYISEFDDGVVADAVRKELQRDGQIFFIHNNIASINKMATKIKNLVPEVKLDVAHGQMAEGDLEKVMLHFFQRKIDMLVCTTIVESGLDIPSANTILVNRADKFGLAQMYQLRGRVGRSDEQAYAYLFIPNESLLSKNAQKRLKVLMEHSDLGSGFQIAMSDLRIRGGGTILGASQSGHIAAVGYEMFLELMENTIAELKGELVQEALEPEINIQLSAFIPESFIPDIDQRLSVYRRLSRLTDVKEISDIKSELVDRYGKLPEETVNLLLKIMLRIFSIKAGVKRMDLIGGTLSISFSEVHMKNPGGVVNLVSGHPDKYKMTVDHTLKANLQMGANKGLLSQTKNILKEISRHVNN
jgi:transcription-repair coupling factor (superfamily II helicase)